MFRYWDVCNYDFNNNRSKDGIADHFTQLVWGGTTKVGFGVATGVQKQKTCVFVVARYFLPGNVGGQNRFNVFKGTFVESQCAAHVLPLPQTTSTGSSVNDDGASISSFSNTDDEDMDESLDVESLDDENPDGNLKSQLDKKPIKAGILSTGSKTFGATIFSIPSSKKKPKTGSTGTPTIPTGTPLTTPTGTAPSTPTGTPPSTSKGTPSSTPIGAPPSTPIVSPTTIPTGTPPSTLIGTPSSITTGTPATATTGTPPSAPKGTPPSVTAKVPQQFTTSTAVGNPIISGPLKQIAVPSTGKTVGSISSTSPSIGTAPTTGSPSLTTPIVTTSSTKAPSTTSGAVTTNTQQPTTSTSTGTQPSTTTTSTKEPSKTISGVVTTNAPQPITTYSTGSQPPLTTTTSTKAPSTTAGVVTTTTPVAVTVPQPATLSSKQPQTNAASGGTPATALSTPTTSSTNPPVVTGTPGSLLIGGTPSVTGTTPPKLTPNIGTAKPSTSPNSGSPTSAVASGPGTSYVPPAATAQPVTSTSSGALASGKPSKIINTGPSKQVLRPVANTQTTTATTVSTSPPITSVPVPVSVPPPQQPPLPVPPPPLLSPPPPPPPPQPQSTSVTSTPPPILVIPSQNGVNLNRYLYPGLGFKVGTGATNNMNDMTSSEWRLPSPTVEMDNDMMYDKINRYEQDDMSDDMEMLKSEPFEDNTDMQMNHFNRDDLLNDDPKSSQSIDDKYDDMEMSSEDTKAENSQLNKQESLEDDMKAQMNVFNHAKENDNTNRNRPPEDNVNSQINHFNLKVNSVQQKLNDKPTENHAKPQANQLNKSLPTSGISSSALLKINHPIVHPWGNPSHYYRDQNIIKNEKYLTNEMTNKQHNLNDIVHFDDSMDSMDSDMTSWDDQGLEDDSKIMSGSFKDSYGNMFDYDADINNDMSGGYHDSYEGNRGTSGTDRDTEWIGDTMDSTHRSTGNGVSMYKDSKAYPKQTQDDTGYIDSALLGHSHDLKGLEGINGLSSYGGVGLPLQEYADELGEVRGLHHKSSHAKEKLTVEKRHKTKSKKVSDKKEKR